MLDVYIEIEGRQELVGHIDEINSGHRPRDISQGPCFRYDPNYLKNMNRAISNNLPLRNEPFSPQETAVFFEGLLPEGFTRRAVAQHLHVDEGDYPEMLAGLGNECLGAVRISSGDVEMPEPSYEPLSVEQVRALAEEGQSMSADLVTKAHLSLTGASGKVGLYYEPDEDRWFLPLGSAPSTHIVKQSHIRFSGIVENEQLSMRTAKKLGILVPDSFIINTGEGRDEEILFATERYDRVINDKADIIDGLKKPYRLHQEDFGQAMGITAAEKYEHPGEQYLNRMFSVIESRSLRPVEDTLELWCRMVFNFLIGNTDGHIKNSALLYSPGLDSVRLAPAYDIVSTVVYENAARDMAVGVGEVYALDEINRASFEKAAEDASLGHKLMMDRFDKIADEFEGALKETCRELSEEGFPQVKETAEIILKRGGIANI